MAGDKQAKASARTPNPLASTGSQAPVPPLYPMDRKHVQQQVRKSAFLFGSRQQEKQEVNLRYSKEMTGTQLRSMTLNKINEISERTNPETTNNKQRASGRLKRGSDMRYQEHDDEEDQSFTENHSEEEKHPEEI